MVITFTMNKSLIAIIIAGILSAAVPGTVEAQCGNKCTANQCCSRFGYCGVGPDYCGVNCRGGRCVNNSAKIADIVTPGFFSGILSQAPANCPGKNFYSRNVFLNAVNSFPQFARTGTVEETRREIAAFFAHASHETGRFCDIEERGGATQTYCDASKKKYPCNPSKRYYGRGPLQVSWNYNYGEAGKEIGFDGLNAPEILAKDSLISFKASLSYWMNNVAGVMNKGFGATIRVINGDHECDGKAQDKVQSRISLFRDYCKQLGVAPVGTLNC